MNSPLTTAGYRPEFVEQVNLHRDKCRDCRLCVRECAFLRKYGAPGEIAEKAVGDGESPLLIGYECSLCGLCRAVCPAAIDPAMLFLEFRREAVARGRADLASYSPLLSYEKIGASSLFTCYHFPEQCDTVLFPGCAISGSRAGMARRLFHRLEKDISNLGMVLDCCRKPSHDLGLQDTFEKDFERKKDYLVKQGVRTVLVLCPNCYKIFERYGAPLEVKSVYEVLASTADKTRGMRQSGTMTVHDPCSTREQRSMQDSIRKIAVDQGIAISEMSHNRVKTFCCGEGGGVPFIDPKLAAEWTDKRRGEAGEISVLTYCSGCVNFLGRTIKTHHILDLLFDSAGVQSGKMQAVRPPLTYLKRLQLKNCYSNTPPSPSVIERILRHVMKILGKP